MTRDILTEEQRLALHALAHFYFARNMDDRSREKPRALGRGGVFDLAYGPAWKAETPDSDEARKDYDNFLRTAAPKGARHVFEHFRKKMVQPAYYRGALPHVQDLIGVAFGYRPGAAPLASALNDVVDNLSREDTEYWPRIGENYAGIWDVLRYSAHGDLQHPGTENPRVMRAAMEVFAPKAEGAPPTFQIDYRPHGHDEPLRTSRGSILSLGKGTHMEFVGWEAPRRYPINIVAAQREDAKPGIFLGLVTRYHEHNFFFAARVAFVRSSAKSLRSLEPKLAMHRRDEIREMFRSEHAGMSDGTFDDLMTSIVNRIGAKGTSGLRLD